MGDTSQHTFQNQENTIMVVIQVNILLDEPIQWYPWVIQVNIFLDEAIQRYLWVIQVNKLFKIKKQSSMCLLKFLWQVAHCRSTLECLKKKTTELNVFIEISMTSSTQQINTWGFEEKQQSSMCLLKFLWQVAHSRSTLEGLKKNNRVQCVYWNFYEK